jgi:PAT family beta-lactamase induction signal transducer AmpG
MALCASRIAASQFAIYMALSNLAISVGSGLTGPLGERLEFNQIFYGTSLFDLAMVCCLLFFNLDRHKAGLKRMFASIGNSSESGCSG